MPMDKPRYPANWRAIARETPDILKQITVAECDICGRTEKARPETFRSCKTARCWTKRPEEGQMAGMAWEDGA